MKAIAPIGRALAGIALAVTAVVAGASPATAHAVLISTNPADGSTLEEAPREIVLTFDEEVDVPGFAVRLLDESGTPLEVGAATATDGSDEPGATSVTVSFPVLADGRYLVRWQSITSDDFHPVDGELTFGVGAGFTVTAVGASVERPVGGPLESLARGAGYVGFMIAVGGLGLLLALRRELFSRLPARRILVRAITTGVVVSLVGLIALEVVLSFDAGATPPASFLVFWGTAVVSIVVLGMVSLALDRDLGGRAIPRVPAAVGVAASLTAAWGLGHLGHGASVAGSALTTVHLAATAVWAGGVALLVVICIPAVRHGAEAWVRAVVRRFAIIAVPALALSVASGSLLAAGLVPSWGGLTGTQYGNTLALKVAFVGVAVVLGGITAWRARRPGSDRHVGPRLAAELAAIAGVVLLAVTLAGGQPPDDLRWQASPSTAATSGVQSAEVDDLVVTLALSPGLPGSNFATVRVLDTRRPAPAPVDRVLVDIGDGEVATAIAQNATDWLVPATIAASGPRAVNVVVKRVGWEDSTVTFPWEVAPLPGTLAGGESISGWWALLAGAGLLGGLAAAAALRPRAPRRTYDSPYEASLETTASA
jgi:copper transport protein